MLEKRLGCPSTFAFRRQELAVLRGVDEVAVSDEQVPRPRPSCRRRRRNQSSNQSRHAGTRIAPCLHHHGRHTTTQVLQSFLDALKEPDGAYINYLRHAQIGVACVVSSSARGTCGGWEERCGDWAGSY